jgi:pSer/pThr/pTyr-binding forkhead associated (FHA) protein
MGSFLHNGGVGPLEFDVRPCDGEMVERRTFHQPFVLIGRSPAADLRLEGDYVSERHAYLQAIGGRVFAVDMESRHGVHWPGGPRAAGWLHVDQPVRVGNVEVRLRSTHEPAGPADPADPLTSNDADPRLLPGAAFEIRMGGEPAVRWRVNRPLTLVGRADACKLRLRDLRVSGFHCSLTAGPLGVWVVDLLSREGIRVNGERVRWAALEDGDRLEVGPFLLRVYYDAPAAGQNGAPAVIEDRRPVPVPAAAFGPATANIVSSPALPPFDPARLALEKSLLLPVIDQLNQMQQQMFDQFHQSILTMAQMFSTMHREQMDLVREEMEQLRRVTAELQHLQAQKARGAATGPAAPAVARIERKPAAAEVGPKSPPSPAWAAALKKPAEASPAEAAAPAAGDIHDWLTQRIAALQEERQGRWQKVMNFMMGR